MKFVFFVFLALGWAVLCYSPKGVLIERKVEQHPQTGARHIACTYFTGYGTAVNRHPLGGSGECPFTARVKKVAPQFKK